MFEPGPHAPRGALAAQNYLQSPSGRQPARQCSVRRAAERPDWFELENSPLDGRPGPSPPSLDEAAFEDGALPQGRIVRQSR